MVSIKTFAPAVLLLAPALAGSAPENDDSPKKVGAIAHFDNGETEGVIEFSTAKNGTVKVSVEIDGLPETGGPFLYHIHNAQVGPDGDCEDTGSLHLNPYNATSAACSTQKDHSFCEVGDLSGKHGTINGTSYIASYYDPYLSLNPNNEAFILGHSITVHFANKTKIACGNIHKKKEKKLVCFYEDDDDEEEFDYDSLW